MREVVIIRAIVGNLPGRYRDLAGAVAAAGGGGGGERVSTSKVEAPSPINDTAVDIRRDIVDVLAGWADYLVEAVGMPEDRVVSRSPEFTAGLLLTFWQSVYNQPWIQDLGDEVAELARRADDVTNPPESRKIADRINEGLIDGRDVATALGVSPSTVRAWVAAGELDAKERGANGRNYYALDDIRRLKIKRDIQMGSVTLADAA